MTKEFILAIFCFGSPLLSGSYPKTPSTTKSPQHRPVWNRWEGSPQIKYLCRDRSCFSKENTTQKFTCDLYGFQEFSFFHYWLDYKQFWCWWHSRKVLFWLHNWICQIASPNASPSACLSKTWPSWWWGCWRWRWTPRPERLSEGNLEVWGVCSCQRWKNAKFLIL